MESQDSSKSPPPTPTSRATKLSPKPAAKTPVLIKSPNESSDAKSPDGTINNPIDVPNEAAILVQDNKGKGEVQDNKGKEVSQDSRKRPQDAVNHQENETKDASSPVQRQPNLVNKRLKKSSSSNISSAIKRPITISDIAKPSINFGWSTKQPMVTPATPRLSFPSVALSSAKHMVLNPPSKPSKTTIDVIDVDETIPPSPPRPKLLFFPVLLPTYPVRPERSAFVGCPRYLSGFAHFPLRKFGEILDLNLRLGRSRW